MLADVVPELRLGDEHEVGRLRQDDAGVVGEEHVVLPPEIGETGEAQALRAEEVLETPDEGELQRGLLCGIGDLLIEYLEVEGVVEIRAVEEIVQAHEEGAVDLVPL